MHYASCSYERDRRGSSIGCDVWAGCVHACAGLNALLQNRMDRAHFQERFLRPGSAEEAAANAALQSNNKLAAKASAKEVSAESMFNNRMKLGALLANRPDKQRLERLHILQAPSGSKASNAFAGLQAQLEASKRKDKLNNLLQARPSFDALSKRGIVQDREQKASESQGRVRYACITDERDCTLQAVAVGKARADLVRVRACMVCCSLSSSRPPRPLLAISCSPARSRSRWLPRRF